MREKQDSVSNRNSQKKLGALKSFGYGVMLPYFSLRLVFRERSLFLLSLIPVLVALILAVGVFGWANSALKALLLHALTSFGWDATGWFVGVVFFLVSLTLLLLSAVVYSFLVALVATPLNDVLAEKTEPKATPPLASASPVSFSGRIYLIWIDVVKTIAIVLISLTLFALSWIPVLNLLLFIAHALLLSFQYLSYPQTRRGIGFLEGLKFVFRYPFSSFGLGAVLIFLFSIPILSAFSFPLAVMSGTLLFARAQNGSELPRLS